MAHFCRIKDIIKMPAGRQVSPSQMSLLLLASALTQSTMGLLIPRGWIVLSDKGKKFGADVVVKELGN